MVMPTTPIANLVVRQAGFALPALDGFFPAMGGQGDARKRLLGSFTRSVRQVKVILGHALFIQRADDYHCFFVSHDAPADLRLHATGGHLYFRRPFVSVANMDSRPSVGRERITPMVDAPKR